MFGVIQVCRHSLDDELQSQWQAHLCGLCLSLRNSRGQLSRAATNTDAVLLSVLVEAQQERPLERADAGLCPLRGMRTAKVVPAGAAAARLGATASLTLAAAKAQDVRAERTYALAMPTVRTRAVGLLAEPLRRRAFADEEMASAVQVADLLAELGGQAAIERGTGPGDSVLTVTAPTATVTGSIFATAADVAGHPENAPALREIGAAFGSLAHLLDAVTDLADDRRSGSFNPIQATGTSMESVRRECARLVCRIRAGFDALSLVDGRLARILLVDGTHAAVHRAFGEQPAQRCSNPTTDGRSGQPGGPPAAPGPADPSIKPWTEPPEPTDPPGPLAPEPPAPPDWPDPPAKDIPRPPFLSSVLPWIGVYCTGFACCASHQNPCTGRRHEAGCSGGCSNCCDCGDCGDGCCCDCDCNC
jgi:hypothetical protein